MYSYGMVRFTCISISSLLGKKKISPIIGPRCPEGSRNLGFSGYVTMTQNGGKVVSLMHRPFYLQEILLVLMSVRG